MKLFFTNFKSCRMAIKRRRHCTAYTLVEVLVTTTLVVLIMAMLIPVLGKARESARYTSWLAMSSSIQADPRVALYYNFVGQTGDELNAAGEQIVLNKSSGDPMGLVASEQSSKGAQDPELRYGVMKGYDRKDHRPEDFVPTFEANKGRFRAKTAMEFYGKSNKQGSYITPDYWAGVVDGGQFQVGIWMKIDPYRKWQKPISWGTRKTGFLAFCAQQETADGLEYFKLLRHNRSYSRYEGKKINPFDDDWHFVVLRLQAPFSEAGKTDNPNIAEVNDLELSVDGSPFRKVDTNSGNNAILTTDIDELFIGAEAGQTSDSREEDFIRGLIDEVIIWQEPTTYEEIKSMYRIGAPMGHATLNWQNP